MPELNFPVMDGGILEANFGENLHGKADSERSCSPKSEWSGCGSEVSSVEYDDVSSDSGDSSSSDQEALTEKMTKMNLSEDEVKRLSNLGGDVRHMMVTSYQLTNNKPELASGHHQQRVVPGKALRDMAKAQREAMEAHDKKKCVAPPPGFERMYGVAPINTTTEPTQEPILVAYADGSNTLNMAGSPMCLHNITVASTVDACHVFIKQMNNPTHAGLAPLEEAMMEAYTEECGPELLRPIAKGSLLAVKSDGKWYRCQMIFYNESSDSCDIKFVDHGGYTTVPVQDLRQLRTDFIRLPFQAIEVYLAHVSPATDDVIIDIVSDILFRENVSIQVVGYAEDNIPVVQAFFYVSDYVHLLQQDIVEDAYKVYKSEFPDHIPVPTKSMLRQQEAAAAAITAEDEECAELTDWAAESDEGIGSQTDESEPRTAVQSPSQYSEQSSSSIPVSPAPSSIYSTDSSTQVPVPVVYTDTGDVEYVPMQPVLTYCIQDPNTGVLYYVAAPILATAAGQPAGYLEAEGVCEEYKEEIIEKPVEEWTQEDYEKYYEQDE